MKPQEQCSHVNAPQAGSTIKDKSDVNSTPSSRTMISSALTNDSTNTEPIKLKAPDKIFTTEEKRLEANLSAASSFLSELCNVSKASTKNESNSEKPYQGQKGESIPLLAEKKARLEPTIEVSTVTLFSCNVRGKSLYDVS